MIRYIWMNKKIKMMKNALTLLLFFFIGSLSMSAQTVDEILETYFENTGGEDAWLKLEGMKMSASVNQQGMDIPIYMYTFKEGQQLMKFNLQGKEVVQMAFDGESGWVTNFMTGTAEPITSEEAENMKRDKGTFPDPFLNYKEKGYSCEMMGKETIEGVECFKIKLTRKPQLVDGVETPNESYYFFDSDNYVPIAIEEEITDGEMKGKVSQQIFSDFQEVDGLYFPFSIEEKLKGTEMSQLIVISKIELNPEYDAKMFVMPVQEEKMEEAAPAGGK